MARMNIQRGGCMGQNADTSATRHFWSRSGPSLQRMVAVGLEAEAERRVTEGAEELRGSDGKA
ncbi:MAG: hypothetical protein ACP5E5_03855 [Acidobacteriaceae bacterium]